MLDCFAGSGTSLIAAEKCGRRARVIEFDPAYCDRIVKRFETFTGKQARLAESRETFEDVAATASSTRPSMRGTRHEPGRQPRQHCVRLPLQTLESLPDKQRRRFFEGEWSPEIEGALWTLESIDRNRIKARQGSTLDSLLESGAVPSLKRVVVAVDPSGRFGPRGRALGRDRNRSCRSGHGRHAGMCLPIARHVSARHNGQGSQ